MQSLKDAIKKHTHTSVWADKERAIETDREIGEKT